MTTIVESLVAATEAVTQNAAAYQSVAAITKADQFDVIREAGIDPNDNAILKKLLRGLRSGLLTTFSDTGAVNALVIAPPTAHTTLFKGLPFRIWPKFTNTGAATLRINDLAPVPILRADGSPLGRGDITKDRPVDVVGDGIGNVRIVGLAPVEVRRRLSSDLVVWVRPDGSDANDGGGNAPDRAFKTIQGAWNALSGIYDTAGFGIDIRLGVSARYAGASLGFFAGRVRIIGGDLPTTDIVIYSPAGLPFVVQSRVQGLEILNCQLDYTYTGAAQPVEATVWAAPGGTITLTGVAYNCIYNRANLYHNYSDYQSAIQLSGGQYFVTGNGSIAGFVFSSAQGSFLGATGSTTTTITTGGNLSVGVAWCRAATGGIASWYNVTFLNAFATGARYSVDRGGLIDVSGAGENFLPGSVAGSKANGGIYA